MNTLVGSPEENRAIVAVHRIELAAAVPETLHNRKMSAA